VNERGLDRAEGGLGIGLTLVRKLVELHGGTVSAHSPGPGRGSTLLVRLPLRTGVSAGTPGGHAGEAAPSRPLRVLVVDDNLDSVETMSMLLRTWGHDVRTAAEGTEALSTAADFAPDVVLLDIGLPGMTGYDVARRLRPRNAARPLLVALTGYGQPGDRARSQEAGFDLHFVKPVDLARLETALSALDAGRA